MKSFLPFSFILGLTSICALATEPKQHPQKSVAPPIPQMVLVSFTLKRTDFARGLSEGHTTGIRNPHFDALIGIPYKLRQNRLFRREYPGSYQSPSEPLGGMLVSWKPDLDQQYGARMVDVSASTLRDIYGADAITDVVEEPYERVHHEDVAKERLLILDALKKSAGDPLQAAERLRMNPRFFGEQDLVKKVTDCQRASN